MPRQLSLLLKASVIAFAFFVVPMIIVPMIFQPNHHYSLPTMMQVDG